MNKILFYCFLIFLSSKSLASGIKSINNWKIKVVQPTQIKHCNKSLWAYSLAEKKLIQIRSEDGVRVKEFSITLKKNETLTYIECGKSNSLYVALFNKVNKNPLLKEFNLDTQLFSKGELKFPKILSGLVVYKNQLLAFSDQIYASDLELNTFKVFKFNTSKYIPPSPQELAKNPFKDWQRGFDISEGRYTKGAVLKDSLWLLDPFKSKVVNRTSKGNYEKWGSWGVWDDKLLFPKDIVFYKEHIILSDVGLKRILIFDLEGKNKGSISHKFEYPISLASNEKSLFISDFMSDTVISLDLEVKSVIRSGKKEFRRHHFKGHHVLKNWTQIRCMNCHDGTEAFHLEKFGGSSFHHPVQIKEDDKVDLPLMNNSILSCTSCHDAHHRTQKNLADNLIKPTPGLCIECHKNQSIELKNHFSPNKSMGPVNCMECHQMHGIHSHLLNKVDKNLCLSCHQKHTKGFHIGKKNVNCISCHQVHGSKKSMKFAKTKGTCFECHNEKAEFLGKNSHLSLKLDSSISWKVKENQCLSCHRPHKAKLSANRTCLNCHKGQTHIHKKKLTVAQTQRSRGIKLSNGKVSCVTCHDPHKGFDKAMYLRPNKPILKFCTSCHDTNINSLYENYHERGKGK